MVLNHAALQQRQDASMRDKSGAAALRLSGIKSRSNPARWLAYECRRASPGGQAWTADGMRGAGMRRGVFGGADCAGSAWQAGAVPAAGTSLHGRLLQGPDQHQRRPPPGLRSADADEILYIMDTAASFREAPLRL